MPRRRDKRSDTSNSDDFAQSQRQEKGVYFANVQPNSLIAPDLLEGDGVQIDATRFSIRAWTNTLMGQRLLPWVQRKELFQRALSYLPYSYKLWHNYLVQFREYCQTRSLMSKDWRLLIDEFKACLTKLPKMPRIWLMYGQCLERQHLVSQTRAAYNWSLRNLPLTQHDKIWAKFVQWSLKLDSSATALAIVPRYLKLQPDFKQKYSDYLRDRGFYDQCVAIMLDILDDTMYNSRSGRTKEDFFMEVVALIADQPEKACLGLIRNQQTAIIGTNIANQDKTTSSYDPGALGSAFIRRGLKQYPVQVSGRLWVKLADMYIRLARFQQARNIFEQALVSIDNVKDFGVIFNAYCKYEQQMISALASAQIRKQHQVTKNDYVDQQIAFRCSKLEDMMSRQPYLLHRIVIRKNKNNVRAWLGLADLYIKANKLSDAIAVFEEALAEINFQLAEQGKLSKIFIDLAHLRYRVGEIELMVYRDKIHLSTQQRQQQTIGLAEPQVNIQPQSKANNQNSFQSMLQEMVNQPISPIELANNQFVRAVNANFKLVQDYVSVWVAWIEMMLQKRYYNDSLRLVKHVLFRRRPLQQGLKIKNIDQLLKSTTSLWQLYLDIQLSIGTNDTLKIAYQRCKQHKCLTPMMLLNYTDFLWQNAYFQQAFRVFQFGVANFKWPALYQIWICYLLKFIARYGQDAIGVERIRSLFENLLRVVPIQHCFIFYFMYAQFQEKHGLYSHAVQVYDRMVTNVAEASRLQAYNIYICKVGQLLGVTKCRSIFQAALSKLKQKQVLIIGQQFAQLETKLGEKDRARAVYVYTSQFTDPSDDMEGIWAKWEEFEVQHGDKDTYKEYLRIKRSVQGKFLMLPPDLDKIEQKIKNGIL